MTEWAAYYQLDPFGSVRGDMHAAIVASTFFNVTAQVNTPKHKKAAQTTLGDFMPKFEQVEPTQRHMSAAEIHARVDMMLAARSKRRG